MSPQLRSRHGWRRWRHVQRAIIDTLGRFDHPVSAGELSAYGEAMRGIRASERDEELKRLVRAGQVVAGQQVRLHWGASVVFQVFSLPTAGGRP